MLVVVFFTLLNENLLFIILFNFIYCIALAGWKWNSHCYTPGEIFPYIGVSS